MNQIDPLKRLQEVETTLSRQNDGRQARLVMSSLGPVLDAQVMAIISKMRSAYREGKADHLKLLAFAAELCTLEDIENKFKQKIVLGDRAQQKERELDDNS